MFEPFLSLKQRAESKLLAQGAAFFYSRPQTLTRVSKNGPGLVLGRGKLGLAH